MKNLAAENTNIFFFFFKHQGQFPYYTFGALIEIPLGIH